jgi:hypothetical protein
MSTIERPLTVRELRDQLDRIIRQNPLHEYLAVTFDVDATPVRGGIVRAGHLSLAPIRLDGVGGF